MEASEKLEYERRIKDLESELDASIRREELLTNPGKLGSLKTAVKRTKLGRIAANPSSRLGKIVRAPRTVVRIIRHPSLIQDIKKRKQSTPPAPKLESANLPPAITIPINYLAIDNSQTRVNFVISSLDTLDDARISTLKHTLSLADSLHAKLRIIFCSVASDPTGFQKYLTKHHLKTNADLEFYSSLDQAKKGEKQYLLEVGPNDLFINVVGIDHVK